MTDFHDLSALEQARALREGHISSQALTHHYLTQIQARNDELGAFVSVQPGRALRAARRADALLTSGRADGAIFLGVPSGIKDLDPVRRTWTTLGSRAYKYLWSPIDGPVAKRIRAGGFVLVGKLATSEFGIMPVTETDIHSPCRNPWDRRHSPGGSSGGSASAVAGGLLPIAQASDGAGSIRIPASFCHLVGFKPSRGVMPNFYKPFDPADMICVGSVSRTVEDAAAFLDVLVGRRYDPRSAPAGSWLASCAAPPRKLRIAFNPDSPLGRAQPHLRRAVVEAADLLRSLGHDVQEQPIESGTVDEFIPIYAFMSSRIPVARESILQAPSRWLRAAGRGHTRGEILARARGIVERVARAFGDFDAWLSPTSPVAPPRIGAWRDLPGEEAFRRAAVLGANTAILNLSGQPAVSMPFGHTEAGLPIGVQLSAARGEDTLLMALARQFEEARGDLKDKTPEA